MLPIHQTELKKATYILPFKTTLAKLVDQSCEPIPLDCNKDLCFF